MTYEYKLNSYNKKKYGFNYLTCNGWMGIYADNFNQKLKVRIENGFTYYDKIKISLTDKQIERITETATSYKEY